MLVLSLCNIFVMLVQQIVNSAAIWHELFFQDDVQSTSRCRRQGVLSVRSSVCCRQSLTFFPCTKPSFALRKAGLSKFAKSKEPWKLAIEEPEALVSARSWGKRAVESAKTTSPQATNQHDNTPTHPFQAMLVRLHSLPSQVGCASWP